MWADIDDTYEASSDGYIRNKKTLKVLNGSPDWQGYIRVTINGKHYRVHRLVLSAFVPKPPGMVEINHLNGCKADNSLENLEWCTHSENMKHAYASGLENKQNRRTEKLAKETVVFIRENFIPYDKDLGITALSKKLGVSTRTISRIANGETWRTAQ